MARGWDGPVMTSASLFGAAPLLNCGTFRAAAVSATRPGPGRVDEAHGPACDGPAVGVEGLLPDTGWPGVAVVLPDQGQMPGTGTTRWARRPRRSEPGRPAVRTRCGEGTGRGWWRRPPRGAVASWRRPRCCSKRPNRRPPGAPWAPLSWSTPPAGADQFAGGRAISACEGIVGRESELSARWHLPPSGKRNGGAI